MDQINTDQRTQLPDSTNMEDVDLLMMLADSSDALSGQELEDIITSYSSPNPMDIFSDSQSPQPIRTSQTYPFQSSSSSDSESSSSSDSNQDDMNDSDYEPIKTEPAQMGGKRIYVNDSRFCDDLYDERPRKKERSDSKRGRRPTAGMTMKTDIRTYEDHGILHYNFRTVNVNAARVQHKHYISTGFPAKYANAKFTKRDTEQTIILPDTYFKMPRVVTQNTSIKGLLTDIQDVLQRRLSKEEMRLIPNSLKRSTTRYVDLLEDKTYYAGLEQVSTTAWKLILKNPTDPFPILSQCTV